MQPDIIIKSQILQHHYGTRIDENILMHMDAISYMYLAVLAQE